MEKTLDWVKFTHYNGFTNIPFLEILNVQWFTLIHGFTFCGLLHMVY